MENKILYQINSALKSIVLKNQTINLLDSNLINGLKFHKNTVSFTLELLPEQLKKSQEIQNIIEKKLLNERIRKRFVTMIQEGAIEEVKENIKHWHMDFPGLKAIGAQEIYSYLTEEITLDEAINKAIIRTRQYAKRQRTWFRSKMTGWTQIEV